LFYLRPASAETQSPPNGKPKVIRALLLQPDLRGLVVHELVDQRLQVLGQRHLDRADELLLPFEISGREDFVLPEFIAWGDPKAVS